MSLSPSPDPGKIPIAIVGIAAQLPSGGTSSSNLDHKEFFDFLLNKGEAYERIPMERFNIDSYKGHALGRVCTEFGAFLKHTDQLDHVELGITSKDVKSMPLSTRKLIELSFLALLDSGIEYRGQNIGCFASGIISDGLSLSEPDEFEARGSFGGSPAMIANRISYHLDLLGPSVPVDTACSSSLTATHLGVQSIRVGDCDAAVVGGVQLNHRFFDWVQYSQGGILSPDGKCKPFDATADGFSRGEGGVVIVLKRLDKTLEDNDKIYATILGTGINSTGSAAPVNAPVAAAQRDAMQRAWKQAGRAAGDVDFVEVHATGTAAGDPTEANWVGEAFRRDDELLIGSVKGNIGHTEITAFLASLTKAIHIFRSGIIPPNVNFSNPNPRIGWDRYRLRVPTEGTQLSCRSKTGRSLIGLCSSGIGGSNGHVVLEAPPPRSPSKYSGNQSTGPPKPLLLLAGALSPRTTTAISDTLLELVSERPDLSRFISAVYGRRSRQMPWRSFAVVTPGQTEKVKFSTPQLAPRGNKPPIVFVFPGQGPQHIAMGRELFAAYPVFRESILGMDSVYSKVVGESLLQSTGLFLAETDAPMSRPLGEIWSVEITLPALAMLQCALVDLLASLGIHPDITIGHSAGETSVLYASGAASKEVVVELSIARGRAMAVVQSAGGTMAALSCGVQQALVLIQDSVTPKLYGTIDIGCHNSREAVTISGLSSSIDCVIATAESRGIMARKLRTNIAVHSYLMDLCRTEFNTLVGNVWSCRKVSGVPRIAVYSTLTGDLLQREFDADYFWQGTRGPVLFTEAMTSLLHQYPNSTSIELSPHPVLTSYLSDLGAVPPIATLRRPKRQETGPVEVLAFLEALGRFATLGYNVVDFVVLNEHPSLDTGFSLPPYPFVPKAVSYHTETALSHQQFQDRNGPLNYPGLRVNSQTHPVLAQHVIKSEPIMPASGFIEMALEFGATVLWDVEFRAMLSLSREQPMPVEVNLDGLHWTVKTGAHKRENGFDKIHAEGYLSTKPTSTEELALDVRAIMNRCERLDLTNFYEELRSFAEYGVAFQRVIEGYQGENEVFARVRGQDTDLEADLSGYRFHPAIMDCCLHFMVHKSFTLNEDPNVYYLPSKVGRLVLHPSFVEHGMPDYLYTHVVYKRWTPNTIVADFFIVGSDGTRLCTLTDVEVERHESTPISPVSGRHDMVFQPLSCPSRIVDQQVMVKSEREDHRVLYKYLDSLAVKALKHALEKGATAGEQINRLRYVELAERAASSFVTEDQPGEMEIVRIKDKWPEIIDVTDRFISANTRAFSDTSMAAVNTLHRDHDMTKFYEHYSWASEILAKRFYDIVSGLVSSGKRVIKVLEVGAGTGALTRHLVTEMERFPDVIIEFVVSDVSKELLPRMDYPYCRYKSFDLSVPPSNQDPVLSSFDVIMGFHVLHVTSDIQPALNALNSLLVPGGSLLIGDLRGDSWTASGPGSFWFDFMFGGSTELSSFVDKRDPYPMSPDVWAERLRTAGFAHVYSELYAWDPLLFSLEAQKSQLTLERSLNGYHPIKTRPVSEKRTEVFNYRRGNEWDLPKLLTEWDADQVSLWLFTNSPNDGYAGMGFSRSLAREYLHLDVHFVIFEGEWSEHSMLTCLPQLEGSTEPIMWVSGAGTLSVPRVVPSQQPSGKVPFNPGGPWTLTDEVVTSTFVVQPTNEYSAVNIIAISRAAEGSLRGFVGRILSPASDSRFASGRLVAGIALSKDITNRVAVHHESLVPLTEEQETNASSIAGSVLALVICHLAFAMTTGTQKRVLLTTAPSTLIASLKWALGLTNGTIVEAESESIADLAQAVQNCQCDLVISGSIDPADIQVFTSKFHRRRRVLLWNDPVDGVAAILHDDPGTIGEAIQASISRVESSWYPNSHDLAISISDVSLPPAGTAVPASSAYHFDPSKAYLLVGGIGRVGIRVALWMYQKGARYIVLTSRSGRESLELIEDSKTVLRIVAYLESQPDLTIRLEASDATSVKGTHALLHSIPSTFKLGGCMLLTAVLLDRSFALQTADDFDRAFSAKTGACQVLDECIPDGGLSALDFFVPFTSVVGLFGNGGQTNYSSANTALDGLVRRLDNAFSLVLPVVTDCIGSKDDPRVQVLRLGHLTPWGMTSQQICNCLEDGLRKLASDGPSSKFWLYIPHFHWPLVQKHMGPSPLFSHLLESTEDDSMTTTKVKSSAQGAASMTMTDIVLDVLDVPAADFDASVPFTAYGLDSLSAARLSLALRPRHLAISQLQLLADVSLNDLVARSGAQAAAAAAALQTEVPTAAAAVSA